MDYPQVSVILVGENLSSYLPTWFLHLEQQDFPYSQFECIIYDTGDAHGNPDRVEALIQGSPLLIRYNRRSNLTPVQAWNEAFREAKGEICICTQIDVIPSPQWISTFVFLQKKYQFQGCIGGVLMYHPRLSPKAITKWFLPEEYVQGSSLSSPSVFQHFHWANLCLPRREVINIGGLNNIFRFAEVADIELLHRMQTRGYPLHVDEQAVCWIWKPISYVQSCVYLYSRGYSWGCFLRLYPQQSHIVDKFKLYVPPYIRWINGMVLPYYHRICSKMPENARLLKRIYTRLFRYWRYRGFQDAISLREPAIGIITP